MKKIKKDACFFLSERLESPNREILTSQHSVNLKGVRSEVLAEKNKNGEKFKTKHGGE